MIRKKLMVALTALFAVGLIAGPLAADEWSTGQEWEDAELECNEDGEYPDTQDAPTGDDCAATHEGEWDEEEEGGPETYTGRQWDNQVTCHEGAAPDVEGIHVNAAGDPDDMFGGAGVCNDGDTAPIQGRIVVGASEAHGGAYAYADGTDGNESPADGWVRADVTTDGPGAGCGASEGKRDATAGDPYDPGNCGGGDLPVPPLN